MKQAITLSSLLIPVLWMSPVLVQAQSCEEGALANMPTERFLLQDDGVAVDRVTGLAWQRCAVGQVWDGGACLESAKKQVKSWFSWRDAHSEVQRINATEAGKGWRLPSVQELRTLIARNCADPAINTDVFPNAPAWFFWSATEYKDNPDYAWQIDFKTGEINAHLKVSISYHIRLVKGSLIPTSRKARSTTSVEDERMREWNDGIHDPANPDLSMLQLPSEIIGKLPRDSSEQIDWAKSLVDKLIAPRASRIGDEEMVVWDQDIVFKDTAAMPHVSFPHKLHSMWLACENCHDAIFPAQRGKVDISMGSIYSGEHCGVCHGKVAFSPHNCERCHSILHEGSPVKWW